MRLSSCRVRIAFALIAVALAVTPAACDDDDDAVMAGALPPRRGTKRHHENDAIQPQAALRRRCDGEECACNCDEDDDNVVDARAQFVEVSADAGAQVAAPTAGVVTAINNYINPLVAAVVAAAPPLAPARDLEVARAALRLASAQMQGAAAAGAPGAAAAGLRPIVMKGWTYHIDVDGRVRSATSQAAMTSADCANGDATNDNTRAYANAFGAMAHNGALNANGFDAGHIRAASLGGERDVLNFVPQMPHNNQEIQCGIERIAKFMMRRSGCRLQLTITYAYAHAAGAALPLNAAHFRPSTIRYQIRRNAAATAGTHCNLLMSGGAAVAGGGVYLDLTFPNI